MNVGAAGSAHANERRGNQRAELRDRGFELVVVLWLGRRRCDFGLTHDERVAPFEKRADATRLAAGRLHGPMVVSMRPIKNHLVQRAIDATSRYPIAHGAPLATGDPKQLGVPDISKVDWGKFDPLADDETPVWWGCGVTPQSIAMACKVPEMITHLMGHMFVTDLLLRDCTDKPAYGL